MKKVSFNDELETINVNSLKDSSIIGIKIKNSNFKGHILKINTNQYVINNICSNNSYVGKLIFNSISEILKYKGIEEVFTFKSRKELLNWITS